MLERKGDHSWSLCFRNEMGVLELSRRQSKKITYSHNYYAELTDSYVWVVLLARGQLNGDFYQQ